MNRKERKKQVWNSVGYSKCELNDEGIMFIVQKLLANNGEHHCWQDQNNVKKPFADMFPFLQFPASAFLSSRVVYSLTLKIERAYPRETLLIFYQNTRSYIPEDSNLYMYIITGLILSSQMFLYVPLFLVSYISAFWPQNIFCFLSFSQ